MRSNCRNHIDKIKNKSENVYESYKTFRANIYFTEVIKVFNKQSIIHYINKPQHTMEPSLTLITCLMVVHAVY